VRRDIVERSGQAMVHVSTEASRQVDEMRNEIRRAQNIFDEAIDKLVSSFHGMNSQIQRQQQLGLQIVSGGSEEGSVSEFQRFASKTSNTLRQFVDSVVENSRLAMSLVEMTDLINKQMSEVRGMLGEIEVFPNRPICWRSMRPSRRRGLARRAGDSPWWLTRCVTCPGVPTISASRFVAR
jgi:methyl-accepting chemotaxis protein